MAPGSMGHLTSRPRDPLDMVGLGGVEPPTSPLSGVRSNQLSYRPGGQRRVVPPRVLTNQLNIRIGNL